MPRRYYHYQTQNIQPLVLLFGRIIGVIDVLGSTHLFKKGIVLIFYFQAEARLLEVQARNFEVERLASSTIRKVSR